MKFAQKFKGRLPAGTMNNTEAAYAKTLEARKIAGEILWFAFEAITLKIASNQCRYTPDFAVMLADGSIEFHEVKGSMAIFQDDAKVKAKVASDTFPARFVVVTPRPKKDGGGWQYHEY